MPRPRCCRRVAGIPPCERFTPEGVPASSLEEVVLGLDEMEALRLADLMGLYQEDAAKQMNVSRQTFGRIIDEAHKKVARALTEGKALRIDGGSVEMANIRAFRCRACEARWELPLGTGRPRECPKCERTDIQRVPCEGKPEQCPGKGRGRCKRGGQKQAGQPDVPAAKPPKKPLQGESQ
jgi:uncharacterized protein